MRWRRLDVPGTDECELVRTADGWRVEGVAEFGAGARLRYSVDADERWYSVRAEVAGTVDRRPLDLAARRDDSGHWSINDRADPSLHGLIDIDLGFTPATNLFPLRRLSLAPGEAAAAEALWLDDATWTFRRLPQRYERRDALSWWYEAPTVGYSGLLTVTPDGFVRDYPGLWIDD